MPQFNYKLEIHTHGDHAHFNLNKDLHKKNHHLQGDSTNCNTCEPKKHKPIKNIGKNEEGCPCCLAAVDLDEVATALNEIAVNGNLEPHEIGLPDFSSSAHWGILLGISGPLALMGLTAAYRNVTGTLNNGKKLEVVIKGVEEGISKYSKERDEAEGKVKEDLGDVVKRLEAFRETLKYSKFDTNFNLVVPGFINGVASTIVLSSAMLKSPYALPVIALYAGCQTTRNGYDLWRTWNRILPEEIREEVQLNMDVGIRKINQITDSKRKFYAANTIGFATFTAGAVITSLSAFSVVGSPGLAVGIPLLAVGAVSTGITNNIWTAKFKPRNGDLGINRIKLDLDTIQQEIGERREIKKLLKNYRDKHLPDKSGKSFGCSLLSSLPFCNEKGQKLLHKVNQSRISESGSNDKDILDLLERAVNVKKLLKTTGDKKTADNILKKLSALKKGSKGVTDAEKSQFRLTSFDNNKSNSYLNYSYGKNIVMTGSNKPTYYENIFESCRDLEIDTMVLDRFIKNAVIKSSEEHDKSIKNKEKYFDKLKKSGLFTINGDDIAFDPKALIRNYEMERAFMRSLEEFLLFDYINKLTYEQYGLNDFYWALEKQNKKQVNSANKNCKDYQEKKINIETEIDNDNIAEDTPINLPNSSQIHNLFPKANKPLSKYKEEDFTEENPNSNLVNFVPKFVTAIKPSSKQVYVPYSYRLSSQLESQKLSRISP